MPAAVVLRRPHEEVADLSDKVDRLARVFRRLGEAWDVVDKTFRALAFSTLVVGTLTACATSERALQKSGLRPLDGHALAILLARDRTLTWTDARTSGQGTLAADGNTTKSWDASSDTGKWRIEKGTLCTTWTVSRTREACFTLYRTGVDTYKQFWLDGSWRADLTMTN